MFHHEFHAPDAERRRFHPDPVTTGGDADEPGDPSTIPGRHLPHAMLLDSNGGRVSTRDLVRYSAGFVLITGAASLWSGTAEAAAAMLSDEIRTSVSIRLIHIVDYSDGNAATFPAARSGVSGSSGTSDGTPNGNTDVVANAYLDVEGVWERVRGVARTGAVLVRPDGIVVWRVKEFVLAEHASLNGEMRFSAILRRALRIT